MAIQKDVIVEGSSWQNLNTLTGITVGVEMVVQNKGSVNVLIYESISQPLDTFFEGAVISRLAENTSIANPVAGSDTIWVRSGSSAINGLLNVQEVV